MANKTYRKFGPCSECDAWRPFTGDRDAGLGRCVAHPPMLPGTFTASAPTTHCEHECGEFEPRPVKS